MHVRVPDNRHPGIKQICKFFATDHLTPHLRVQADRCAELAQAMVLDEALDGPELTTGLRKLLEAKDCFVRAALD